jgi:hypothetical protein
LRVCWVGRFCILTASPRPNDRLVPLTLLRTIGRAAPCSFPRAERPSFARVVGKRTRVAEQERQSFSERLRANRAGDHDGSRTQVSNAVQAREREESASRSWAERSERSLAERLWPPRRPRKGRPPSSRRQDENEIVQSARQRRRARRPRQHPAEHAAKRAAQQAVSYSGTTWLCLPTHTADGPTRHDTQAGLLEELRSRRIQGQSVRRYPNVSSNRE